MLILLTAPKLSSESEVIECEAEERKEKEEREEQRNRGTEEQRMLGEFFRRGWTGRRWIRH